MIVALVSLDMCLYFFFFFLHATDNCPIAGLVNNLIATLLLVINNNNYRLAFAVSRSGDHSSYPAACALFPFQFHLVAPPAQIVSRALHESARFPRICVHIKGSIKVMVFQLN